MIFITEYMSSGSLKQFLKKTKKNHKTMNEKVSGFFPSMAWLGHGPWGKGHVGSQQVFCRGRWEER